ncbi:MAG: hypothetical protein AB7Q16_05920 [Vicinamibacterales bacterium]
MRRLRGEHWFWLLVVLSAVSTLDKAGTWAEVFTPKGVAEMALVMTGLIRTALVAPHPPDDGGLGHVSPPRGDE